MSSINIGLGTAWRAKAVFYISSLYFFQCTVEMAGRRKLVSNGHNGLNLFLALVLIIFIYLSQLAVPLIFRE